MGLQNYDVFSANGRFSVPKIINFQKQKVCAKRLIDFGWLFKGDALKIEIKHHVKQNINNNSNTEMHIKSSTREWRDQTKTWWWEMRWVDYDVINGDVINSDVIIYDVIARHPLERIDRRPLVFPRSPPLLHA